MVHCHTNKQHFSCFVLRRIENFQIQLNEQVIKTELKDLVKQSIEATLTSLLDQEAEELANAATYQRTKDRKGYRADHYTRNLQTTTGSVSLKVPKLKGIPFETAIIKRCRRYERRQGSLSGKGRARC